MTFESESVLIQGCGFDEVAINRGNLTQAEWRILNTLLPVEREPGKRSRGRPPEDKPVIPPRSNRKNTNRDSKRRYRERTRIERVPGHLKIDRAIATRYDQLADSFLGMPFIASARYGIRFVHPAWHRSMLLVGRSQPQLDCAEVGHPRCRCSAMIGRLSGARTLRRTSG